MVVTVVKVLAVCVAALCFLLFRFSSGVSRMEEEEVRRNE